MYISTVRSLGSAYFSSISMNINYIFINKFIQFILLARQYEHKLTWQFGQEKYKLS